MDQYGYVRIRFIHSVALFPTELKIKTTSFCLLRTGLKELEGKYAKYHK